MRKMLVFPVQQKWLNAMTQVQKQAMPQDDIIELRRQKRENFLASIGWNNVTMEEMQADASFRRYYRLHGTPTPMLMMQDPPDRPPVPPFVMVEPYIKIDEHMRSMGLHAPQIFHRDIANGLLIIEDFGDDTYTRLFARGVEPKGLYELAVDVLAHLHKHPKHTGIDVPKYNTEQLVNEAMLLMDWYYPALTGKKPSEELRAGFANVWSELFKKFPANQDTLVLRDYHVDNLMVVPGASGLLSCGLLDFQDALIGHASYDLMSLLEDARRDVPQDLQKHLHDRYMKAVGNIDRAAFDYAYRVLAAQRHAKVLGIFVRLSVRDGKTRYLQFIPHVHKLFIASLNTPILAPLKQWFADNNIDIYKELPK